MLTKLQTQLATKVETLKSIENEQMQVETKMKEERNAKVELQDKVNKDQDRKNKIQDELTNLQQNLDKENKNRKNLEDDQQRLEQESNRLNLQNSEKDKAKQEIDESNKKLVEQHKMLEKEIKADQKEKTKLIAEKANLQDNFQKNEKRIVGLRSEISQNEKQLNKLNNQKQSYHQQTQTAVKSKESVISSVNQLQRQVVDTRKMNFEDKEIIKALQRGREVLENDLRRIQQHNKEISEQTQQVEAETEQKILEIRAQNKELENLSEIINELDKDQDQLGKQAAQANAKYFHSLEEIKLKDNLISEFQKKNIETEAKLKQQQNLYEAVRSDRNLYSKNLSETQDEIAEFQRRYKIVNHQISQLNEEKDAKEVALAKERFEHKKQDKTIQEHSRILQKFKKEIDEKNERIINFTGEISKLHFIIKESEQQRQKLKEEYELVVAERDILGTQLIRRNDESALLYEKIQIQQQTLANGEASYRERLGDIELLRYKIADLMRSLKIYRKHVSTIPGLKNELGNLQRELIDVKLKVKALSQELQSPVNAHRCRKLMGTDPDIYEMRQKLQTLQRRLIMKTEQVVEREVLKQQKEKQIQELREIMKRQPGIEEAQKLSSLQQSLKTRTRQMKALAAELNMYQAQINEYQYDIEQITQQVQQTKRKYLEQRKREQIQRDAAQEEVRKKIDSVMHY